MSTRNEAAERLRTVLHYSESLSPQTDRFLDEALAAERRATVERIRERLNMREASVGPGDAYWKPSILAILDEVSDAAR